LKGEKKAESRMQKAGPNSERIIRKVQRIKTVHELYACLPACLLQAGLLTGPRKELTQINIYFLWIVYPESWSLLSAFGFLLSFPFCAMCFAFSKAPWSLSYPESLPYPCAAFAAALCPPVCQCPAPRNQSDGWSPDTVPRY
jgi:hypothetical protein